MNTPAPECERMLAVKDESQAIGAFIDWLQSDTEFTIAEESDREGEYWPAFISIEKLLARYFDIDLNKVEAEKRAMLEELRNMP